MTSWPQLTEGGSVWLPDSAQGALAESLPVLQPLAWPFPARGPSCAGRGRARCPSPDRDNLALPCPQLPLRNRFHEWPSFPDSGLAELPAGRPNQRPQSAGGWGSAWSLVSVAMNGRLSCLQLPPTLRSPSTTREEEGFFSFLRPFRILVNCVILRLGCGS